MSAGEKKGDLGIKCNIFKAIFSKNLTDGGKLKCFVADKKSCTTIRTMKDQNFGLYG